MKNNKTFTTTPFFLRILKNTVLLLILASFTPTQVALAQTVLSADGQTNTYKLINSVLSPNGNAIETPDCAHEDFGDHIDQVMDDELRVYVFRFHIHVNEDNDRCKNDDRQRNEIKTYDKSPDHLKAVDGETVEYKWKFKLPAGFQTSSSFTHLHQVKAVGGSEEGMPLITLTARSTNKLQIRYAKYSSQETIHEVALSPFLGHWVEATERITFGENGTYSIEIKRISDNTTLLSYNNDELRMWKTDANFLRPKWGIYRSLNNWEDLRDEILLFNDFSIQELEENKLSETQQDVLKIHPNPTSGPFTIEAQAGASFDLCDISGRSLHSLPYAPLNTNLDFNLKSGTYLLNLNYSDHTVSQKIIVL